MNASFPDYFKNFLIFFKKTLKFPKTLPLPILDGRETAVGQVLLEAKKLLKIFSKNPKVPPNSAVTGLDVAKKSRFTAIFFDSKQDFFEDCHPPPARFSCGFQSDLRVFVRQTPTGRVRHFLT